MNEMSASEARANLPAILDRVQAGDEVTILRHGRPVAVVVRPDRLRTRRLADASARLDELHELLHRSRATPLAPHGAIDADRADEMAREITSARRRR
jgi:prevent-host-death family protein